jgi:predicted nucleic acid-binding protein
VREHRVALVALDTDVSSLILRDTLPPAIAARLVGNKLALSFVTVGELTMWVEVRHWGPNQRARLEAFMRGKFVMLGDEDVSRKWGQLAAAARRDGRPRPANDSWIAACCLVYGIPLATRNERDYVYYRDAHGLQLITA